MSSAVGGCILWKVWCQEVMAAQLVLWIKRNITKLIYELDSVLGSEKYLSKYQKLLYLA